MSCRAGRCASVRHGVNTVEIMISILVLALAMIPTIGMFTTGRESAHMSEHQIYAELLCARATEEIAARPFGHISAQAPAWGDLLNARFKTVDARAPGVGDLKEYLENVWKGPDPIQSTIKVDKAAMPGDPAATVGEGLLSIKVSSTWGDLRGNESKKSSYHVVRLRAKRDYGARACDVPGSELNEP